MDRLSVKIIEGIINRPFGSEERIRFILDNLPEFLMLANYYNVSVSNGSGGYASPMDSKFFPLIIAHRSETAKLLTRLWISSWMSRSWVIGKNVCILLEGGICDEADGRRCRRYVYGFHLRRRRRKD